MNEQKIREAYGQHCCASGIVATVGDFILFKAGYMALLNSLVLIDSVRTQEHGLIQSFILPEGVTKND